MYQKKNIHFVGIGGIGMSAIAEVLHQKGFSITGSDISERRFFTTGIKGAFMLSELIPRPTRITHPSGSEAISPHTSTDF